VSTSTFPPRAEPALSRPTSGGGWWFAVWYVAGLVLVAVATGLSPVLGLCVAAAMVAVWVLVPRPTLAGYTMAAVVPLTSGLARGNPLPGLRVSEVLTVALGVMILLTADHRRESRWTSVDRALAAYAVVTFALGVLSRYRDDVALTTGDLGTIAGPLQYLVFLRALTLVLRSPKERITALSIAVASSIPVSVLAIVQGTSPALDRSLKTATGYSVSDWGNGGAQRVTSLFPHAQVLSAYLAAIILTGVAMLVFVSLAPRLRRVIVVALGFGAVALVMTETIAAMGAALAGVAVLVLWSPRRLLYLAAMALVVTVLGGAFSSTLSARQRSQSTVTVGTLGAERDPLIPQSVAYRAAVWTKQTLPALKGHELLGVGPTLPSSIAWRSTESMYFTLLFRGGVILLAVFLATMFVVLREAWQAASSLDPGELVAGRVLFVLAALLLAMFLIQPYLTYGGVSHIFWLLAAVAMGGGGMMRTSPPTPWRKGAIDATRQR
jgi:hypothetical protein